jgi:hypothetical protein
MKTKISQAKNFRYKYIFLCVALLLTFILTACGGQAAPDDNQSIDNQVAAATEAPQDSTSNNSSDNAIDPASISFANDVQPLFIQYCTRCHGDGRLDEGLNLLTYADVMAGSENGAVIISGDPDNSLLAQMVVDGEMPKRGAKPSAQEIQVILDWIKAGAQDN